MVIAGAGGHALEIFDVLLSLKIKSSQIVFYDDYSDITSFCNCKVLKSASELKKEFLEANEFCLGVGSPKLRKKLYQVMMENGGKHYPVISPSAVISNSVINNGADILVNCFVSAKVKLGIGSLVNTSVNLHHQVEIGSFNEISPSTVVLGNVKIGNNCSVGANATILPEIELSNNVLVGAGAVVTKNIMSNRIVKGIPAK